MKSFCLSLALVAGIATVNADVANKMQDALTDAFTAFAGVQQILTYEREQGIPVINTNESGGK